MKGAIVAAAVISGVVFGCASGGGGGGGNGADCGKISETPATATVTGIPSLPVFRCGSTGTLSGQAAVNVDDGTFTNNLLLYIAGTGTGTFTITNNDDIVQYSSATGEWSSSHCAAPTGSITVTSRSGTGTSSVAQVSFAGVAFCNTAGTVTYSGVAGTIQMP